MSQEPNTLDEAIDEDDFDTIGDYHRMAARHFQAAAKHHLAAAAADDEGDDAANARHALQAYRHQLSGVQCAEIAQMESESVEDDLEEMSVAEES